MMQKLKAILVDDEESARDVLENLLKRFCPDVELLAKCPDVETAVSAIQLHGPELVFLDIEMPNYAGYELVKFFPEVNFNIIFVTAYDQYAIKAFELAAIDYLLKPIDIDRLRQAVSRAHGLQDAKAQAQRMALLSQTMETQQVKNLVLNDKGMQHIVGLEEIIAIEAQESYCTIYTADRRFMASKNLKHFENLLTDSPNFMRVHKSWMINKLHILHYSKSELQIRLTGDLIAKLSKYQRADFEAAIRL